MHSGTRQFSGSIWETHEKSCVPWCQQQSLDTVIPGVLSNLCLNLLAEKPFCAYDHSCSFHMSYFYFSCIQDTVITLCNIWACCGFSHKPFFFLFHFRSSLKSFTSYLSSWSFLRIGLIASKNYSQWQDIFPNGDISVDVSFCITLQMSRLGEKMENIHSQF